VATANLKSVARQVKARSGIAAIRAALARRASMAHQEGAHMTTTRP
jgi:hypothetical protein